MKHRRYKVKKLSPDKLKGSGGKVATENMFSRDMEMARMFVGYMIRNIKYLKKYETDNDSHDRIQKELDAIQLKLIAIDDCFSNLKGVE